MPEATQPGKPDTGLIRGVFRDDLRQYKVRASSPDAPDSFQVITGEREDIVLIISGLNSGDLKATWGPFWRSHKPNWKIWVEESAFRVFYNGSNRVPGPAGPNAMGQTQLESASVSWRFCDG
ncbi:hypothetical protein [Glycomyces harbinensis]|uniref:Uncharacterized protein n=1 Tax=Glycomyces harbinensis TaxID=58114 RepID=A0A1G6Y5V7_9ACTN|nr:hypothetical protein [Glycomyces harbinensis]SDD85768.1 hypothetical protein SAMN05216270_108153 [Glycomyces harbinensis]